MKAPASAVIATAMALLLGLTVGTPTAAADPIPERPEPPLHIANGLGSDTDIARLTDQLVGLNAAHDMQVGVMAVHSTDGQDVEAFTDQVSQEWGMGKEQGALVVLVADEYKVRLVLGDDFATVVDTDDEADILNLIGQGINTSWIVGLRAGLTALFTYAEGNDPHSTEALHQDDVASSEDDADMGVPADDQPPANTEGPDDSPWPMAAAIFGVLLAVALAVTAWVRRRNTPPANTRKKDVEGTS